MTIVENPGRRRADQITFRVVYFSTLPVFVFGALLARLRPARRRLGSYASDLSVFGEARAGARTCGSFALMG